MQGKYIRNCVLMKYHNETLQGLLLSLNGGWKIFEDLIFKSGLLNNHIPTKL